MLTPNENAARVMVDIAAGRTPDRSMLISAALHLQTMTFTNKDPDLLAAAHNLERFATGSRIELNDVGRERVRRIAGIVRALK